MLRVFALILLLIHRQQLLNLSFLSVPRPSLELLLLELISKI